MGDSASQKCSYCWADLGEEESEPLTEGTAGFTLPLPLRATARPPRSSILVSYGLMNVA